MGGRDALLQYTSEKFLQDTCSQKLLSHEKNRRWFFDEAEICSPNETFNFTDLFPLIRLIDDTAYFLILYTIEIAPNMNSTVSYIVQKMTSNIIKTDLTFFSKALAR